MVQHDCLCKVCSDCTLCLEHQDIAADVFGCRYVAFCAYANGLQARMCYGLLWCGLWLGKSNSYQYSPLISADRLRNAFGLLTTLTDNQNVRQQHAVLRFWCGIFTGFSALCEKCCTQIYDHVHYRPLYVASRVNHAFQAFQGRAVTTDATRADVLSNMRSKVQ